MAIEEAARVAARLRREAIAWMDRLGGPDFTPAVQSAFMAWILADPRHECALREASQLRGAAVGPAEDEPYLPEREPGITAETGGDCLASVLDLEPDEGRCDICGHALSGSDPGILDLREDPPPSPDAATLAAAASWVRSLTTSAPAPDLDCLRDWLCRDPRHRVAFLRALLAL